MKNTIAVALLALASVCWGEGSGCKIGFTTVTMTSTGQWQAGVAPQFFWNWWGKNQKKYPDFCNTRAPISGKNFVIAFSRSEGYFSGFYPRTVTNTTVTPFSGTGTVYSDSGSMWIYSFQGTETATSTTQYNAPYTDRNVGLYIATYDSSGRLIRQDGHIYSSRTGGDPANSLGYNLGSLLAASGARGKMIKHSFEAMAKP
jgi:hypothetical protein